MPYTKVERLASEPSKIEKLPFWPIHPPSLSKLAYNYNYVDLYSGVVLFFFPKKRVQVSFKNRVRVRVGLVFCFRVKG